MNVLTMLKFILIIERTSVLKMYMYIYFILIVLKNLMKNIAQ